ncbi:hypothetical protein [Geoglobus ahangari]
MSELKQAISELLATMRNEEFGFDVRCDQEGIRVYVPDGTNLGIINAIAELVEEKKSILIPLYEELSEEQKEVLRMKAARIVEINEELSELTKQLRKIVRREGTIYAIELREDRITIEEMETYRDYSVEIPYDVFFEFLSWLREMGVFKEADVE